MQTLNDDAIKAIGHYTGVLHGAEAYVSFAQTCKRMNNLLLSSDHGKEQNQVARSVIRERAAFFMDKQKEKLHGQQQGQQSQHQSQSSSIGSLSPQNITSCINTLEQLSVFEAWVTTTQFIHDNRIRFPFASTEIEPDMMERVAQIANILKRFPNVTVRLDSHCGTAAPSGISSWFSRARGLSVRNTICNGLGIDGQSSSDIMATATMANCIDQDRVSVVAWGKTVARVVARLQDHPFRGDAMEGRGWAEVYFMVPGCSRDGSDGENMMVLPPRQEYYKGIPDDDGAGGNNAVAVFVNFDESDRDADLM